MSDVASNPQSWLPDDDKSPFVDEAHVFLPVAGIGTPSDPRFDEMRPAPDLKGGGTGSGNGGGIDNGYGAGRTELIAQTYDATDARYEFSGNQDIDAVLIGSRWTATTLTFSFPTSGSFYTDGTEGTESAAHVAFNAMQQTATRYALAQVSAYTNLNFTEITETATTHANLRLSQTDDSNVGSAYGNFPSSSTRAGDIWFGRTGQPYYDTPAPGNWGQATIMHELGHTLGLKHGHQDYTSEDLAGQGYLDAPPGGGPRYGSAALPSAHDGQDWSLMTYRSDPANSVTFEGEGANQPQTYMQDDIAALQYLYGADFTTNSGATTYTWSTTTGEMSINGVGQGAPTANIILRTVWDGNGIDTYDLSNYATDLSIDLNPGAFSTFSDAQLANHRAYSGGYAPAAGNVANALLYNGDTRSLIENATGGSGDDRMIGNQADNTLIGNDGADTLVGSAGSDVLQGGSGNDTLYGDGIPGQPSGVGFGSGFVTKLSGAGNNTLGTAIDVTNTFSLANDADIIDPTTTPHVTISGTGDGNRDYYKILVNAGTTLTFDIDHTSSIDSFIKLYDAAGNLLAYDDDSSTSDGAGGSTSGYDSFLTYTATTAGYYVIEVGDYLTSTSNEPIASGATYELQISAAGTQAIGGGSGNDTLDGGTGADTMRGGGGDDSYFVDDLGDRVLEYTGGGNDTVFARSSYVLQAGYSVEILRASSVASTVALDLTGNELAQTLVGNSGANRLDGGGGADTMRGGLGDDSYYVDNSGDLVFETGNAGNDTVFARTSYALQAGQSVETLRASSVASTVAMDLTGNELAQTLLGNAGANRLDGGAGADTMRGYGGDDTYFVDNAGDLVFEAAGGGNDTVFARASYGLAAGQAIETLRASSVSSTVAMDLTGNSLAQSLYGNAGNNVLDGGGGGDSMRGYGGNDTYVINNASDLVFETAGQGTDTVNARVSYVLATGQSIETLKFTSASGTGNLNLTGNELAQTLLGNNGNNTLDGRGGGDSMRGYAGDDTYVINSSSDLVFETTGQGSDTVNARVSYTLAAGQSVETLKFTSVSGTGNFNLIGNEIAQTITGNNGNNLLDGKGGADILRGYGGADIFRFSSALGSGNIDHIVDFSTTDDTIRLDRTIFSTLGLGTLDSGAFKDIGVSGAVVDSSDRILYDHNTGALYYDADGSGGTPRIQFAVLDNKPAHLTYADFFVVS